VKPIIARIFPFDQAAKAQQFLENEHPVGKVVLAISATAPMPDDTAPATGPVVSF